MVCRRAAGPPPGAAASTTAVMGEGRWSAWAPAGMPSAIRLATIMPDSSRKRIGVYPFPEPIRGVAGWLAWRTEIAENSPACPVDRRGYRRPGQLHPPAMQEADHAQAGGELLRTAHPPVSCPGATGGARRDERTWRLASACVIRTAQELVDLFVRPAQRRAPARPAMVLCRRVALPTGGVSATTTMKSAALAGFCVPGDCRPPARGPQGRAAARVLLERVAR
jgi:hypothetical protein